MNKYEKALIEHNENNSPYATSTVLEACKKAEAFDLLMKKCLINANDNKFDSLYDYSLIIINKGNFLEDVFIYISKDEFELFKEVLENE